MNRFFNRAGPCRPEEHYMVPPLPRLKGIKELIDRKEYFILHAPRQVGKTTYLYALMRKLNEEGNYTALQVNIQPAAVSSSLKESLQIICECVASQAELHLPSEEQPPSWEQLSGSLVKVFLKEWAKKNPKPIVLFIDEVDALRDELFLSLLHQLRSGYEARPTRFPQSVSLIGLRDVRDYKIKIRKESESLGTSSPFNIKSKSLTMKNFSEKEVNFLLNEHEKEKGQVFSKEVREKIFDFSQGQPWLVNSLAREVVDEILEYDYQQPLFLSHVIEARERLIQQRETHLDSLIDKLKEDRVKRVVEAIIAGQKLEMDRLNDDLSYVSDLGLIQTKGNIRFANPIYGEIIPRVINYAWQVSFPDIADPQWYIKEDGRLDMDSLLKAFQKFFRRHSESWLERFEFKEAGRQLLLMAFLQRVVNSGGRIEREMAVGNERLDLAVFYGEECFVLELKLYRDTHTLPDGKDQLHRYLSKLGLGRGYLVLFETRKRTWEKKIYWKTLKHKGKQIELVGL